MSLASKNDQEWDVFGEYIVIGERYAAYEGLDQDATRSLQRLLERARDQWALSYSVLYHLAIQVTRDVAEDFPQLYTEPYQILAMLDPANAAMRAVISVTLPVWIPSEAQLSKDLASHRKTQHQFGNRWIFGPSGPAYLSGAFYHEMGHVLSIAALRSTHPTFQPSAADRLFLEEAAECARRSAFPPAAYRATANAIRWAWRPYRRWRWG